MTDNIIMHRRTSTPPPQMPDGALAIDEAAQTLYASGLDGQPIAMKLNRQGAPALTGDPDQVLVQGPQGLEFQRLSAGGGGQPVDSSPWCVPGLMPQAVGALTVPTTGLMREILLSEESELTALRVRTAGAAGIVEFALFNEAGVERLSIAATINAAGELEVPVQALLAPGRYSVRIVPQIAVSFQSLRGCLPRQPVRDHVVFMKVL